MDILRCRPETYYCHEKFKIAFVVKGLLAEIAYIFRRGHREITEVISWLFNEQQLPITKLQSTNSFSASHCHLLCFH